MAVVDGVPVTSVSRTLVDPAEVTDRDELRERFAAARAEGLLDHEALAASRTRGVAPVDLDPVRGSATRRRRPATSSATTPPTPPRAPRARRRHGRPGDEQVPSVAASRLTAHAGTVPPPHMRGIDDALRRHLAR
jgi:mRNA-degrading endonuclease toxin of MazEF toxin-antitoxin module